MGEQGRADRQARADRILDTARELLLRWGYRRVTIDELARRAGVGKGTLYLHWGSREELFQAVSTREAAAMTEAVIGGIARDPARVALHRYLRALFVEAMNRPVLRALYTRDTETLDALLTTTSHRRLEQTKLTVNRDYLSVLAAEAMLRDDLRPSDLDYPLPTLVFGFFAVEPFLPPESGLSLQQKADQLAETVRRTFEPPAAPDRDRLGRAAEAAIPIFQRLADDYRAATYGGDHSEHTTA